MDYFNAFWFGGLVCALIQILLDKTKLMPGRVMVLLVCNGALLSAVGVLPAAGGFCRCRGLRPADRFRTCIMGGYEKSH